MMNSKGSCLTGAQLNELREELKIELRALILSSKDGMTEREMRNEYRKSCGKDIAYALLGFNTLHDLLKDLKDCIRIERRQNIYVYFGIYDERTKDLGRLVQGQLDRGKSVRDQRRSVESYRKQFGTSR
jgi:tudor domain-containing protein 5